MHNAIIPQQRTGLAERTLPLVGVAHAGAGAGGEEAHRQMMRLLAYSGQRGAALEQYDTCCQLLSEELGIEPTEETVALCGRIRAGELELLLKTRTAPSETAAILVEPVLGEGGYVVPTPGFLQGLRRICDEHGILLIADEVQSGFGRTGKWFAVEHFDVAPDVMVIAKGLASGLRFPESPRGGN